MAITMAWALEGEEYEGRCVGAEPKVLRQRMTWEQPPGGFRHVL